MGFRRKLTARFRAFDDFAVSFTVINILSGIFSSFGFGMSAGGPLVLVFGWIGVSGMVLFIGAAMGGKWHPPIRRAGRCISRPGNLRNGIGAPGPGSRCWLNFVGQVGGAAATGYAATSVQAFLDLQWSSYEPTAHRTVLIMALIIVVQGLAMDLV